MKKIKLFAVVSTILAMGLVACNGPKSTSKPDASSPSSQPAPSTTTPAPSTSTPAPSTSTPAPSTSSTPAPSTSSGGQSTSSSQAEEKGVTITESILFKDTDNKVYVKVSGTQANYSAAEFKWAWGLKDAADNGAFINGKAQPEAADYAAATFDATTKAFVLKYCLTDIEAMAPGVMYRVYGGTPETYGVIAFTNSETGAKDENRNYYLRNDQQGALIFDTIQPVSLTKASVVEIKAEDIPEGSAATAVGAYLKFGGANNKNMTVNDLNDLNTNGKIKGHFQRVINNDEAGWNAYARHDIAATELFWKIEGDDVFFYAYIGFAAEKEGWQTHFDFTTGNASANLNMDVVLTGDVDYKVGEGTYRVFADSSKGANQADYYGCLGVYRAHVHEWTAGDPVAKTENNSGYQIDSCTCSKHRVLIDVATDLNGKITKRGAKLANTGDKARYVFPMEEGNVGKKAQLFFKATVDNNNNYGYSYYYGKNGGQSPVLLPDGKTNTEVKFNNDLVVLPETSYKNLGMTKTDESGAGTFLVNEVTLAASNELTLERLDSYGLQYYEIFLVY